MSKRKVLFSGDFCSNTGFGVVNAKLLSRLDQTQWVPYILAINASGDPHPLKDTFRHVYPAGLGSHDAYGVSRLPELVAAIKPDLIVMHNDVWNIPLYTMNCKMHDVKMPPVLAYCPPDAPNQKGAPLNGDVTKVLCPTQFGVDEIVKGGYTGQVEVLPYGVDTALYYPRNKREARRRMGFSPEKLDGFIVGRADRNAERKRYDTTILGFAEWWHTHGEPEDAWLYLHCSLRDKGIDLLQLAKYCDIDQRLMITADDLQPGAGVPEEMMPDIYSTWDLHLSTSKGEGQGMVAFESAACGIAQAGIDTSAYKEMFIDKGAMHALPVRSYIATCGGVNTLGAETSIEDVVSALDQCYTEPAYVEGLAERALAVAKDPRYDWDTIAKRFFTIWDEVARG